MNEKRKKQRKHIVGYAQKQKIETVQNSDLYN